MFLLKHLSRRPNTLKTLILLSLLKIVGPFPSLLALRSDSTRDGNAHTLTMHTGHFIGSNVQLLVNTNISQSHGRKSMHSGV